ncbi:MAG: Crp/Fnr family transcriptional regulator [Bacteroidetes bacterium]|jgi:CRP/FNR family transcriptional regulator|nr:Crp/Fnr family transcriptional regulator [Bacteroidota bacterium]
MNHNHLEVSCASCNARVHSIFKGLSFEETHSLSEVKSCSKYKKGQYIFSENAYPLGLYCINSGKVKLTTQGITGKEQILRLLKDGDVAGYRSLLSNEKYHCSAIALEDCSICFIPKENFYGLLKESSRFSFEMMKLLADNLRKAEEQITSLAQKNVRERMAEALLFFKATYGVNETDSAINFNFSREEIADFVGTSTETAIRLLSDFKKENLINLEGKKIMILNHTKLAHISGLY